MTILHLPKALPCLLCGRASHTAFCGDCRAELRMQAGGRR